VQGVGRRKARQFCITTTSQIIGAVAAAPAAPLSTPLINEMLAKEAATVLVHAKYHISYD